MTRTTTGIIATMSLLCLTAAQGAPRPQRIAVANMDTVMRSFEDFKSAEALLKRQLDKFEQEQDELIKEAQKLKDEFEAARDEADNKALSEDARERKLKEARDKAIAAKEQEVKIRKLAASRQKELSEQGADMRKLIVAKLRNIIQTYADENGIDIVLDASAVSVSGVESIIYSKPDLDITTDLLKRLDAGSTAKP